MLKEKTQIPTNVNLGTNLSVRSFFKLLFLS